MTKPAFIRVGILGAQYFDIPWQGDASMKSIVTHTKADGGFQTSGLFIPYHAIAFMHTVHEKGEPAWAAEATETAQ